jgi:hypothetical protein
VFGAVLIGKGKAMISAYYFARLIAATVSVVAGALAWLTVRLSVRQKERPPKPELQRPFHCLAR